MKLLKQVRRSRTQREKYPFYTRERLTLNTHPNRDLSGLGQVTPKTAKVAKDVVRQIKRTHSKVNKDPKRLLAARQTVIVRVQRRRYNRPGRRDTTSL